MEIWHILVWAVLTVVLIVLEMSTVQFVAIWFAAGGLVSFVVSFFGLPFPVEIIVFILTSFALLICTRPLVKKFLNEKKTPTNVDSMIGMTCVVLTRIDNTAGTGRVHVNGLDWSARSFDSSIAFEPDQKCKIVSIEGVTLIVTKLES